MTVRLGRGEDIYELLKVTSLNGLLGEYSGAVESLETAVNVGFPHGASGADVAIPDRSGATGGATSPHAIGGADVVIPARWRDSGSAVAPHAGSGADVFTRTPIVAGRVVSPHGADVYNAIADILTVTEADSAPIIMDVKRIVFDNGTVTDSGGGTARVATVYRTQLAEASLLELGSWLPYTAGYAPFQTHLQSYSNSGTGHGYNHAVFFGYNAARHSGGTAVDGKPSILMGFEDNYWDATESEYGVEWYLEYHSPDGTSELVRPIYVRVRDSDSNSANNSSIVIDIGSDGQGQLQIVSMGSGARNILSNLDSSQFAIYPTIAKLSNSSNIVQLQSFSDNANTTNLIHSIRARGTIASPSNIQNGDVLGGIAWSGRVSGSASVGAEYIVVADVVSTGIDGRIMHLIYESAGTYAEVMTETAAKVTIKVELSHTGSTLGFYNVSPISRPTTSSGAASFTQNSGSAVNDASTFDGYTIKQVVKALRDLGVLT